MTERMSGSEHIEELAVDYLEGTLDDVRREKMNRHLKGCSDCRVAIQEMERARESYRSVAIDGPSQDATDAVMRAARNAVSPRRAMWSAALAGAAAAAVLMLGTLALRSELPLVLDCRDVRANAHQLAEDERLLDALARYEEASACDPSSPEVARDHHQRGVLHQRLGNTDDALVELHTVLDDYPEYEARSDVLLSTAAILAETGDAVAARKAYVRFFAEYPAESEKALQRMTETELSEDVRRTLRSLGYVQ